MELRHEWGNHGPLQGVSVECPHCGVHHTPLAIAQSNSVQASNGKGGWVGVAPTRILACTSCKWPYVHVAASQQMFPAVRLGKTVKNIPSDLAALYDEARDASSVGAFTACAMVARKALMNLAVLEGAAENKSFQFYVDYLASNGFVPPKGKPWVDKIRLTGNAATHEIQIVTADEARDVMYLLENLLRFNFEMTGP